jgi:hypothetical protein
MITPYANGACRLDIVTKTKTVQLVQQSCEAGPEERKFAKDLFPMVQDSIRDGIYPPQQRSLLTVILRVPARMRARIRRLRGRLAIMPLIEKKVANARNKRAALRLGKLSASTCP